MCEFYKNAENFGYSINIKHIDGTLGKLNPKTGRVIWSDGHVDRFDMLKSHDLELVGASIAAFKAHKKAS